MSARRAAAPHLGMNLPMASRSARNTADNCIACRNMLARARADGSFGSVVADLPQGSGAPRPHRYPSPDGRRFASMRASLFFCCASGDCPDERDIAHLHFTGSDAFDEPLVLTSDTRARRADQRRDGSPCINHSKNNPRLHWPYSVFLASRPVVTLWSSRRPSGALVVWGPRLFSAPVWREVPSSARRATSPIARPSPTAATDASARCARADMTFIGPSVPPGAGGLCRFKTQS